MDGYQLGKDMQSLIHRVGCIEELLRSQSKGKCNCDRMDRPILLGTARKHPGTKPETSYFTRWIGSQVPGTVSVSPGDGTSLRLLAFNLNITPYQAGGQPRTDLKPVWDGLWEAVDNANTNNMTSPVQVTGYTTVSQADGGEEVFFGFYDTVSTYGTWMYVFTGLVDSNGHCCASQAAWPLADGTLYVDSNQDSFVNRNLTLSNPGFQETIRYADHDDHGIVYAFFQPARI